ncbi:MAG: hypothetical protein ACOYJF_01210 [Prevotella sp.]|jgi:hypothetical protein
MIRRTRYIILALTLFICCTNINAQVRVEQHVDSVAILIGEQAHLTLTVTMPEGAKLEWPKLKERQYVVPGVEIVGTPRTDTLEQGNTMKVARTYTLTSFDEHLYALPPLKVKVNGKSYQGGTAALKVITVDVDTVHPNQFFPPKDVQDNPFQWSEWAPYFWLSLLVVVLLIIGFYLVKRLRENKPIITRFKIVHHVPAHQRALDAIGKIKAEKMQTSEDQKTYYTALTDTLRQYIKERFGFNALEMTSSEIIERLQQADDHKMIEELRELFQTADLVKFAKYQVQLNENDMNLVNAINFIDETKQDQQETEERIVPKLSESDKRTRQNRITIKSVLWLIGLVAAAIIVYVIYHLYLLIE